MSGRDTVFGAKPVSLCLPIRTDLCVRTTRSGGSARCGQRMAIWCEKVFSIRGQLHSVFLPGEDFLKALLL